MLVKVLFPMEYRVPAQSVELVGTSELYPVNSVTFPEHCCGYLGVTVLSSKQ